MPASTKAENGKEAPPAASPPAISLAKGGGAIRSMGEKFAANPVTGTASMTIPVAVSPGRADFGPQLSLSYDSGSGNGIFGLGWSLSLPAIARKTAKGLPRYRDSEESDDFILSGTDDLVPVLLPDGTRQRDETIAAGYIVHRYRPRIEGLFARIERWTRKSDGDVHWRTLSRENVLSLYGANADSRIFDPADKTRIFSWLISETRDDRGNVILYDYKPDDGVGVDLSRVCERSRGVANAPGRATNRYLKSVRYGNRAPLLTAAGKRPAFLSDLPAAKLAGAEWMFRVVLDYGEHDGAAPSPGDAGVWAFRADPFSSRRSGFEVRTTRLCRRVLMFHHIPDLPTGEPGYDGLVRSTDFTYRGDLDPSDARNPVYAQMVQVEQAGYRKLGDGSYVRRSLPPVEFDYSVPEIDETVRDIDSASMENLPGGVDGSHYRWVDLHGEGVPGILSEQAGAWFYKRNISPISATPVGFAPAECVAAKPNRAIAGGHAQFMDLAGDGLPDLVDLRVPGAGLYEHDLAEGWEKFRPFVAPLNRDTRDPNVRLIDLTGDGAPDILVTEDDAMVWHPSLAEDGFGPGQRVAWAVDEEKGPRLLFADATQSIHFADLSGDGLTDLVRIRNGEICYWPNLGYGRFGAKITMNGSPLFDHADRFDHRRVLLGDIDGSGTTDIVYLHPDGIRLYFNQSGNGWSAARLLRVLPPAGPMVSVTIADLQANGTASLVWSSPLASDARRPMRYLNLMGATKPHLMVRMANNLGAETLISYATSTKFYLRDRRDGTPWITRLPFPVHVVERVETLDRVARNRFVTRYAYHHGYFDGPEREFRGFGMVEQWDTEDYAALAADGVLAPGDNEHPSSRVAPVHSKTWFHTGAWFGRDHVSDYLAGLLNGVDRGEYYREPGLSDAQARAMLLADSILPPGLSIEEEREAVRALKGSTLRTELYADDGTARAVHPYTVTEQNLAVRLEQGRGINRHAVFSTHASETLTYEYDRDPADPRIQHGLTLEVDAFGNVLKDAAVSYGRRVPDAGLPLPADRARQAVPLVTYTERRFTNAIDDPALFPGDHRTPLLCETRAFELTGYSPGGPAGRFRAADLVQPVAGKLQNVFDTELGYEMSATTGRQRRLIDLERGLFRRSDLTALSPLGTIDSLALAGESYRLAFTPELIAAVFERDGTALMASPSAILGASGGSGGGYLLSQAAKADGRFPASDKDHWCWVPSGRSYLSPGSADTPAAERAYAQDHFFLPLRKRDGFHAAGFSTESLVTYDGHDLLPVESRDAVGNRETAGERKADGTRDPASLGNDYRVLRPACVTDPNGNRGQVAFDALGMVAGSAVMGKPGESLGDRLTGFAPDLTQAEIASHIANPLAAPELILGHATTRSVYDLFAYYRTRTDPQPMPVTVATLMRDTHDAEVASGAALGIQLGFSYSDGFGREVQQKVRAEAGALVDGGAPLAVRWVGTGWTIHNNKGKPVRQFEPFFSATHQFEFGIAVGVSPILFYDPLERVVVTLHPDETYEKAVFSPWREANWDANDTVDGDPRTDPDIMGYTAAYFAGPAPPAWQGWKNRRAGGAMGAEEKDAATKAARHAGTPSIVHLDVLGRAFLTLSDNGPDPAMPGQHLLFANRVELDIEGNSRSVRDAIVQVGDAAGRIVMRYAYDMLGNRVRQESMEAGRRWMLNDAAVKPIRGWDDRGHVVRTEYDPLRRPVRSFVLGADPSDPALDVLTERLVYGEQHPDAEARNLRDTLYLHLDQAGAVATERKDFKGNALAASRRLTKGTLYRGTIDWTAVDADATALPPDATAPLGLAALATALGAQLEADAYVSGSSFDALDRAVLVTSPHTAAMKPSVMRPAYNLAGLLERVDANLRGEEVAGVPVWTAFIANIDYDAKAQRRRILYGNQVSTRYDYDPLTFRMRRMVTARDAAAYPADCPNPPIAGWPGCEVQSLHYTYDAVGNITRVRDAAQQAVYYTNQRVEPSADYTHDALYRLIGATGREHLGLGGTPTAFTHDESARLRLPQPGDGDALGTYAETYIYDAVGNFLEMQHRGSNPAHAGWTRRYRYGETSLIEDGSAGTLVKTGNRLTGTATAAGPVPAEMLYDAHGNMIRMPHLGGAHPAANMHWDYRDHLRQTDHGGGGTAYYVCDASGQRVRKIWEKSPTLTEERIYLGGFEIYRRTQGANRLVRETLHVMDAKRRIALVESRTEDTAGTDTAPAVAIRYQLGNHLGSASLELDELARIVSYEEYSPYGVTVYQATRNLTDTPKRYRFTGRERDEESGFYCHGARYYAPWLGRWTSSDPTGIDDGANTYLYVHANPVEEVDASGKDGQPWWRFTQAGMQYPTGRNHLFATNPGYDTGFAPANLVVNLVVTASNICTIPINAVTEAAALPETIARAAGASEQDIAAMNFALMMTGVGEVAMLPRLARTVTAVNETKVLATEAKAVQTVATEVKAVQTAVTEVKTVATEAKAVSTVVADAKAAKTGATEVKALAQPAAQAKPVANAAAEAKAVTAAPKPPAPVPAAPKPAPVTGAAKPQAGQALVGSSRDQMRRAAAKVINDDPQHPLKFLLNSKGKFKSQKGLTGHANLADSPDLVQMGHITSNKAGGVERLMLQGAWENQFNNVTVEMSHIGGVVLDQTAISIRGVAVDLETAKFWEKIGRIPAGTVASSPVILP